MLRRLGIIEEETDNLETMDETDNQTLDSYSGQPDVLSELILTFAILFVCFRFLCEMRKCIYECCSYTRNKMHDYRSRKRILTMDITDDNLEDLLLSECSVCLERFVIGDKVTILPCYHNFHEHCIRGWLHDHQTCPLCRTHIME